MFGTLSPMEVMKGKRVVLYSTITVTGRTERVNNIDIVADYSDGWRVRGEEEGWSWEEAICPSTRLLKST